MLERLQGFPYEERHFFLHQLVVGREVVEDATVLQSDGRARVRRRNDKFEFRFYFLMIRAFLLKRLMMGRDSQYDY